MNSVVFQRILLGVILLVLVGLGFGYVQLTSLLQTKVTETDHARIEAVVAEYEISKLKKLSVDLKSQQDIITRTQEIVAKGKSYQYQDQIISDVTSYANRNGVTISGFDFTANLTPAGKKPVTPGAPVAPTAAGKKVSATISLRSPLPYINFMNFISQIESNLTKLQIISVNLSPEGKDPRLVNNPTIGIELYIKN